MTRSESVKVLTFVQFEQVICRSIVINCRSPVRLLTGDDFSFILCDKLMLFDWLPCKQSKTIDFRASKNSALRHVPLNAYVSAAIVAYVLVVLVARIEHFVCAAYSTQIGVTLAVVEEANTPPVLEADSADSLARATSEPAVTATAATARGFAQDALAEASAFGFFAASLMVTGHERLSVHNRFVRELLRRHSFVLFA